MANQEHLAILKQGVEVWNEWRRKDHQIIPDLNEANLSGANLSKANLIGADLSKANLSRANLSEANLIGANLSEANLIGTDLMGANLSGQDLRGADLRGADFSDANLSGADFSDADLSDADLSDANLIGTYLRNTKINEETKLDDKWRLAQKILTQGAASRNFIKADLSDTNLSGADFSDANLSNANLRRVNLSATQFLSANFQQAILTGACIQDWNINSKTNLENVICDYIYLKRGKQERRPHDPNKNFAPGEFTKLFQKALETVDLIFSDGIDWQAFLTSFQKLQIECGSKELAIQAIERKPGDAFVVRVEVPPDANKAEIEKFFKRKYRLALKAKEEEYKKLLQAKDKDIVYFRQQNTNLLDIIKVQASKPINITQIQGNNMAGDRNIKMGSGNYNEKIEGDYYEQKGNFGIGHMSGGEIKEGAKVAGVINEADEKQTLAEAAEEIQKLLKQLEESNPTATLAQQQAFVDAAVPPTLKARFVSALQAGWKEALKEFLDNPYVNVGVAVLEGWQNSQQNQK